MTKSVTNALVGILVKQGRLRLKDPAPVPEWRSPGDPRDSITLDELMRMSSGLKFKEDYKDPFPDVVRMLFSRSDAGAFAASMPLEAAPDSRWQYSSGTANIISRIVRQTLGGTLRDYFAFPQQALFDKIGMASAVMEPDPSGTFVGSSFMYATPRDWARFGLLCLNDGVWHAERILPERWMKYSTTPTPKAPMRKYGAQFWLNAGDPGNPSERWMSGAPPDMYHCGALRDSMYPWSFANCSAVRWVSTRPSQLRFRLKLRYPRVSTECGPGRAWQSAWYRLAVRVHRRLERLYREPDHTIPYHTDTAKSVPHFWVRPYHSYSRCTHLIPPQGPAQRHTHIVCDTHGFGQGR